MRLVIIESPFAGKTDQETEENIRYARLCMADCFRRGEAPFASHLLYTQPGILDDKVPEERKLGIEAGFVWGDKGDLRVVYTDRGMSPGMEQGIRRAAQIGQDVETRRLWDYIPK